MTSKTATTCKCEVVGCKNDAVWVATKLFGKGGTIRTCDRCRPGGTPPSNPKLAALLAKRPFYEVQPLR